MTTWSVSQIQSHIPNVDDLTETYFGLQFAHLLFAPAEQFSINVQAVDITVQEALRGVRLLCHS